MKVTAQASKMNNLNAISYFYCITQRSYIYVSFKEYTWISYHCKIMGYSVKMLAALYISKGSYTKAVGWMQLLHKKFATSFDN